MDNAQVQQSLEAALAHTNDGIAWFDLQGNVDMVNETWASMHGYKVDELGGNHLTLFYEESVYGENVVPLIERAIRGGSHEGEVDHLKADGSSFSSWTKGVALMDGDDKAKGVMLVSRPMGERERALRVKEENYRLFLEDASISFFMMDLTGRCTYVNKAGERLLGYTQEDMETTEINFMGTIVEEDLPKVMADFQEVASGFPNDGCRTYRFRTKTGDIKYVDVNTIPITVGGTIVGFHGTGQDATRRVEFAARTQRARKLEAVGTLSSGIAHDFNNILSIILGHADLTIRKGEYDERTGAALAEINKAGMRARGLVKQVLAFSRDAIEHPIPLSLTSCVQETLNLLRSSIPKAIQIETSIDEACPPVFVDQSGIDQVVFNLCTNACQAMADSEGVLRIELEALDLGAVQAKSYPTLKEGQYAKLSVSDTGVGMDEDTMARVFEPYFTTRNPGEGSGLGLSIAHGIVRRCGGDIDLASAPGKGTTFSVFLPACEEDIAPEGLQDEGLKRADLGGSERILVVDDNVDLVGLYKEMLEELGYRVMTFTRSLDALDVFREWPDEFDLVILDHHIPQISGLKLAQEMFTLRPELPIILCSGLPPEDVHEGMPSQVAIEVLTKPFSSDELAVAVRKILDF